METTRSYRGSRRWSRLAGAAVLLAAAVVLTATACGTSSSTSGASGSGGSATGAAATTAGDTTTVAPGTGTAAGGTTLELAADPGGALDFDKTTLEAPAGTVTIQMTNDSPVPHNIAIEGDGVDVTGDIVSNGGTSTITVDLEPGTYTFYCSVDEHEDAGMKGTLTIH